MYPLPFDNFSSCVVVLPCEKDPWDYTIWRWVPKLSRRLWEGTLIACLLPLMSRLTMIPGKSCGIAVQVNKPLFLPFVREDPGLSSASSCWTIQTATYRIWNTVESELLHCRVGWPLSRKCNAKPWCSAATNRVQRQSTWGNTVSQCVHI